MKILVTGVSGTGKTSVTNALVESGQAAIDVDELSHWQSKETGEPAGWMPGPGDEWYRAHDWICDVRKLQAWLSESEHAIVLGHSNNLQEYLPLFDKIYVLSCSPETIAERLGKRTGGEFGKHPADLERVLRWHATFPDYMKERGAELLDAEQPIATTVAFLRSQLR